MSKTTGNYITCALMVTICAFMGALIGYTVSLIMWDGIDGEFILVTTGIGFFVGVIYTALLVWGTRRK